MSGKRSTSDWQLQTPVAFFIFNRPDTTERVFAEIAKARPPKLLVVADGPRPGRPGEEEKCAAARALIERVDWDCQVLKHYAEANLGLGSRMASGLDWIFRLVDEAVILEDDCLPHPTFFRFCQELLERYRDDKRVMTVSGNNFQFGRRRSQYSYYFSRYPFTWGWATWRRAWQFYAFKITGWPRLQQAGWLEDFLVDRRAVKYWENIFNLVFKGQMDTWDYQWILCCWLQKGLSLIPNVNLVSNLGFRPDGTHTKDCGSIFANMKLTEMVFPLRHPSVMIRDKLADSLTQNAFYHPRISIRLRNKLVKLFKFIKKVNERGVKASLR